MPYSVRLEFESRKSYKRAKRLGREAFGPWLLEQAIAAEAAGSEEIAYCARSDLFDIHTIANDQGKMRENASALARLRPPDALLPRYMAGRILRFLGDVDIALSVVRMAYPVLAQYPGNSSNVPFNIFTVSDWAGLARLEVVILAKMDTSSIRIQELLWQLHDLSNGLNPLDEGFAEALTLLATAGVLPRQLRNLIESEWSRWVRHCEFEGAGEQQVEMMGRVLKKMRR